MARQRPRSGNSGGGSSRGKTSPGLARAMRGLKGFASQATAAYGQLNQVLKAIIPTIAKVGKVFATLRDVLRDTVPVLNDAATALGRVRLAVVATIPFVVALTTNFAALNATMRIAGNTGTASMSMVAASAGKAAIQTGAMSAGVGALLAPLALFAAAAGVAYVAIFKWDKVPFLLKAVLLAMSPIVQVIRSIALAWNVATAPFRLIAATIKAPFQAATLSIQGVVAALKLLGSAAVSIVTTAGRAVVRFGSMVGKAMSGAVSAVGAFARAGLGLAGKLASSMASVGGEISSWANMIVTPLTDAGKQFAAAGTAALAMAGATGLSVQSVTQLGYAAEQSGSSVEAVASAVESVNTKLLEAEAGSKDAAKGFEQLGFDAANLVKQAPEDRFIALGVAIAKLESPLDRAAAASSVFGSSNEQLIGMFSQGTAGINEMRKEAERLGLVMSGPQAAAAKTLSTAYASIQNALTGLWRTLGAAVAPQLAETAKQTAEVIKAVTAWVAKNGTLVAQVFKVAAGVATFGAGLSMAASVLAVFTPGLIVLGATLAAGWKAWGLYGMSASKAFQSVQAFAAKVWAEVGKVLGGIKDAIAGGDLELAVETAWTGAQRAWVEGMRALADISGAGMGGILNSLAAGDWRNAASQAWTAIQMVFSQGVSALDDVWTGLQTTIDGVITYLRQQINVAIHEIAKLAMAGLKTANDLANVLAKYDPTGKIREGQIATGKALKGSALLEAAKTAPGVFNAELDKQAEERRKNREGDLAGRQAGRDATVQQLQFKQQTDADQAAKDAAQRGSDVDQKLQDALRRAAAARAAAAAVPVADLDKRDKLAKAAAATTGGGGFGATFSASALAGIAGGTAQEQTAKATQATAAATAKLVVLEEKRAKEAAAMQLQFVA